MAWAMIHHCPRSTPPGLASSDSRSARARRSISSQVRNGRFEAVQLAAACRCRPHHPRPDVRVALQERRAASQLALRALRAVHPDRVDELVVVAEWLIAFGRLLIGDAEDGVFGRRVACLARAHSAAVISGARCTSAAVVSTWV